ncbi:hypothetical protein YC2023_095350 [Brassica napus]
MSCLAPCHLPKDLIEFLSLLLLLLDVSTGLLIAWAILYRRSHKPEVLALDSILALSRSKGFI